MFNRESTLSRTWHAFGGHHCSLLAAAIAYHVLFSFIPLVTFLIAIFGLVMRDPASQQGAADRVLTLLPFPTGTGSNMVLDSIRNVSGQSGTLTVIALVGLLWSSKGIFGTLRSSLNIAWDVKSKRHFLTDILADLAGVIGLGILFAASLAGTVFIHTLQTSSAQFSGTLASSSINSLFTVLGLVLPAVISFVAFLLLYRYVPNVRHGFGDVWFGAVVAAILFEVSKHGFAVYVAHFNRFQALYGALGGIMLFMLWTYLSSLIMLFGAELAAQSESAAHGHAVEAEQPAMVSGEPRACGSAGRGAAAGRIATSRAAAAASPACTASWSDPVE